MHMRRHLPVVCCHASQQRCAATAANLKPQNWDQTAGSTSSSPRPSFSSPRFPRLQSGQLAENNDYAFRPNTSSLSRTSHAPPWPPQAQVKNRPMPSFDISGRPPSITRPPPASAMSKWARPAQLKVPHASPNIRASPPHIPQSSLNINQAVAGAPEKSIQTNKLRPVSQSFTPHPIEEAKMGTQFNRPSFSPSTERPNVYGTRQAFKERGSVVSGAQRRAIKPVVKRPSSSPSILLTAKKTPRFLEKRASKDIFIPSILSVDMLARLLGVKLERLQHKMKQAGMAKEATYDHVLTSDYAALLAAEFGRNPIVDDEAAFDLYPPALMTHSTLLPPRPPIVTIMGHVDHGKTTLLDTLRSASVAKGEAGGITQHIGAFSVPIPGAPDGSNSITFLDTPGHAAFSAMRARGAGVTDIIVLVVAADDGIMPQTKEVLELFNKDGGKVGLVVAINKVDKPGVDTESVQRALLAEGIQLEPYGGDIPCVHVSGMTGHGLPVLMETLSAMSEMQDLRAERQGAVYGHVLESRIQKGLGPVATVLVLRGCLEVGTHIISGTSNAKVRVMNDYSGKTVKKAYPGMAVTVSGWKPLPKAGDEVLSGTESDIKKAIANRARKAEMEASLIDLEAINANRREERLLRASADQTSDRKEIPRNGTTGPIELRLVVKADVSGSIEAVEGALQGIGSSKATIKIIATGVGDISESDILMAKAANATLVGFAVSSSRSIETLASQNAIPIIMSNIIYRLVESVQERLIALLPVVIETKVTGEASVIQLFEIQLKAKQTRKVAGCRVINGALEKTKFVRVVRGGETIFDGSLDTLRQLKKDVTEVRKGSECGLSLDGFTDLREGDLLQSYSKMEKPGSL